MSACIERCPKRAQKVWNFLDTAYWFTFCRISKSRPTLALSAWVSSSSSCGSGTRSWLVGRWGSDGRTAPSAAVWWWTRSSWIRLPAQPAAVWNTACVSFWSGCALGTREPLEERGGEGQHEGSDITAGKSRSPPRLISLHVCFWRIVYPERWKNSFRKIWKYIQRCIKKKNICWPRES